MGRRPLATRAFDFLDYRAFLRAAYLERKDSPEGFTYRQFSALCGFSSSGALKLVIDGHRRLSLEAARRVAEALRLPGEETEFLVNLVRFNDASDDRERNDAFTRLKAAMAFRHVRKDAVTTFEYYRKWYYVAIRELVSLDDFQEDPSWIAQRLTPSITPAQARAAIDKLLKLGMLRRDEDGRLRPAQAIISTESELSSLAVKNFHREMLRRAAEALETQKPQERDIRCVSVAISDRQAQRIKQRCIEFQKEILDIVAEDDGIDNVYQLNVQWFRLTRSPLASDAHDAPSDEKEQA